MRKSLMKFAILDIHYRKFYIVRRKNSPELIKWQQSLVGRFIDIHLQPQLHKFIFILVQVKQSYSISANNPRNIYVSHSLSELFTAIPYSYVFVSLARILFPKKTLHIKMSFMEFSSAKAAWYESSLDGQNTTWLCLEVSHPIVYYVLSLLKAWSQVYRPSFEKWYHGKNKTNKLVRL